MDQLLDALGLLSAVGAVTWRTGLVDKSGIAGQT